MIKDEIKSGIRTGIVTSRARINGFDNGCPTDKRMMAEDLRADPRSPVERHAVAVQNAKKRPAVREAGLAKSTNQTDLRQVRHQVVGRSA